MSARSDPVWDVRGVSGTAGDVQREAKTANTMPRLRGGAHKKVYVGGSEADAWDGASNQLEPAAGQSEIITAPRV